MTGHTRHYGPLATTGYAAHLTYKQQDLLVMLASEKRLPQTTRVLAESLEAVILDDMHEGTQRYLSSSVAATHATLMTLVNRGYVERVPDTLEYTWRITTLGMQAVDGPW